MAATMGQRAAFLASKGFAVFPVFTIEDGRCSCGAAGCSSPGKHPIGSLVPRGVSEATHDAQMIREWWAVYPDANIGVATGDVSGIVVIDIDVDKGGDQSMISLEHRHGGLPETWMAWTGSGGCHFYFRMPGLDVRNSAGAIGPGIDVRGNGGYVVAPPSLHISGDKYTWDADLHPRRIALGELPEWLATRLVSKAERRGADPLPTVIKDGQRNVSLASLAGSMRRRGADEVEIYAALNAMNKRRCNPPLPDGEVRQIAHSIQRYSPSSRIRFDRSAS